MADEILQQPEPLDLLEQSDLSLLETLDHVLDRGLVLAGEITISVADVDLIFMGLNVLLTSTETAREMLNRHADAQASDESKRDE